jgi:hypothetical protein
MENYMQLREEAENLIHNSTLLALKKRTYSSKTKKRKRKNKIWFLIHGNDNNNNNNTDDEGVEDNDEIEDNKEVDYDDNNDNNTDNNNDSNDDADTDNNSNKNTKKRKRNTTKYNNKNNSIEDKIVFYEPQKPIATSKRTLSRRRLEILKDFKNTFNIEENDPFVLVASEFSIQAKNIASKLLQTPDDIFIANCLFKEIFLNSNLIESPGFFFF